MARKANPNRLQTPVMIDKTLKTKLDRLRNKDSKRNGNESDNAVITRIVRIFCQDHPHELHEPRTTYATKSS